MSDSKGMFAERHDPPPQDSGQRRAAVQSHACLLALGDDWTIRAVSDNAEDVLGRSPQDLPGKNLSAIFAEDVALGLRARAEVLSTADPVARMEECALASGDRVVDVTATRTGAEVWFEFETPAQGHGLSADPEEIRRLARRVAERETLPEAAEEAARTLAALTGFARVSVHRVGRSGLDTALGHRGIHPLSDAPGRAVLEAHADAFGPHLQMIPDVAEMRTQPLVTAAGAAPPSLAEIRGLSSAAPGDDLPAALSREEVRAALTVPIRVAGDLWGAILLHHDAAIRPSVGDRGALALFAHLFGYEVGRLEAAMFGRVRARAGPLRDAMAGGLADGQDLASAIRHARAEIASLVPHDGWLLWHQGRVETEGHSVKPAEFESIFAELHQKADRDVIVFDRLSAIAPSVRSVDPTLTALMVIPLSSDSNGLLVVFRRLRADRDRLHNWESWEVAAGEAIRAALIETQFQAFETTRALHAHRQERQGLLIAELNHRMRNILNLIQAVVSQSADEAASVEDYARLLDSRILAVARAYDDLMEHDWGRVPLRVLLQRELHEPLNAQGPAARITGDQIDLSPSAFTTMALVLHELACNARDHGALSRPEGRIDIDMSLGEDGFARLVWRESGGPSARRPRRRGFGLTIIEQSVPHDLRGKAELEFAPGGLVARFALPPGHFTRLRQDPLPETADEGTAGRADDISIDGAALILDDSLIISIESEDLLREAGASTVYACNSVESALQALDNGDVTFALLDVNLGDETSLPVAEQLWIDGIPAVLATGYGADEDLLTEFPPMPVLSKPYTVAEIKDVLRHFSQREGG